MPPSVEAHCPCGCELFFVSHEGRGPCNRTPEQFVCRLSVHVGGKLVPWAWCSQGKGVLVPYNLFASESVCSGHPDKVCDAVSDSILDAYLAGDPRSRVAVETLATKNRLILAGEVTSTAVVDEEEVARQTIRRLGYTIPDYDFDDTCEITRLIHKQSLEIAQGVDEGGAGDQGMMYGYACRETEEYMPLPIMMAHALARGIDEARENKTLPFLRPDGKTQVTVHYEDGRPVGVSGLVLAAPHDPTLSNDEVKEHLYNVVAVPVLGRYGFDVPFDRLVVNGTGVWHKGGPASDTGLTGRKIIVDGYGGMARVGGGAFSGKDPTKVDRSGAYACRYVAKNIVAAGLADRAEVQVAYVIGQANPLARSVETFGTHKVSLDKIEEFAWECLDMSVAHILTALDLRRPIYHTTAAYGHFGKPDLPWERVVRTGVTASAK